jgi:hypothetical protein
MEGDYEHPKHIDQSWIGPVFIVVIIIVLAVFLGLRYLAS